MNDSMEMGTKEVVSFRRTLNHIGAALLLFLILRTVFFSLLLGLAQSFGLPVTATTGETERTLTWWVVYACSNVLSLGLPIWLLSVLQAGHLKMSVIAKPPQDKSLLAAVPLLLLLSMLLSYGFNGLMEQASRSGWYQLRETIAAPAGAAQQVVYFLLLAVLVPLLEEFLFRGVILHSLYPHTRYAILLSALCFGLAHGDLIYNGYAFLMGLAFGYFVWRTHSIWTSVAAHMLVNGVSAAGQLLQVNASEEVQAVFYTVIYLLTGIFSVLAVIYWFRHRRQKPLPKSRWNAKAYLTVSFGAVLFLCAIAGWLWVMADRLIGG